MKLKYGRTILIGFAFMAISGFWQVYDNIIPLILKYNFGIGDTLSGGIMALDNVFALFMLPIFGAWSDKVSTRRGKRTLHTGKVKLKDIDRDFLASRLYKGLAVSGASR